MPPKAKPEKRKRGRPSNASRAQDAPASDPHDGGEEGDEEEDEIATAESPQNARQSAQPKRRRRGGEMADDEEDGPQTGKRKGRRGADTGATIDGDAEGDYEHQPKKRGRPRGTAKGKQPEAARESPDAEEPTTKRKRGRPSRAGETLDSRLDELDGGPAPKRQRGRPRKSDGSDAAGAEGPRPKGRARNSDESRAEPREPGGRGRPRRSDVSDAGPSQPPTLAAAAEPQEPKKRGRTRRSYPSDAGLSQPPTVDAAAEPQEPKKRGRPRRSDVSDAGPSQPRTSDAAAEPQEPKKRGRTRRSDASNATADTADEPQMKRPYTHIVSTQREIPISTISSKWTPLPPPSLALARQILHLSERPVLQSLAPGPRRDTAASAIRTASRRLTSKLSKGLPFPPAAAAARRAATKSGGGRSADGREAELDFEAVASDMEALERRLDPLLHSIAALRAEEVRMEGVLAREAAALGELERNARGEIGMWRGNLRKRGHPLVPDRWDPDGDGAGGLALAPRDEAVPTEWLFMNTKGSLPLSTLTSHIASLRNNVRPVQNLDRAMADSEAAIRRVLSHALGPESYEAAIMAERN